jgi:hypothetical protein
MIFHPSVIALHASALLIGFMILAAAGPAVRILARWDIKSGNDLQLILERRTYLVSTMLSYLFAFELVSFFLFIYTADHLHPLFVGAMCAAGTLKVNAYGYPALLLKMFNFVLAGLWLILNHTDNQAYDYPLIKKKYGFLLVITPLVLLEIVLQTRYLLLLQPNIITSCCGTLFNAARATLAGGIAGLPPRPMEAAFYMSAAATVAAGAYCYRKAADGYLFGLLSGIHCVISILAVLSFIGPYFYELPTHHCPFCILQREYGYIGYPLYAALFGGAVAGISAGMLTPLGKIRSLAEIAPRLRKKLVGASLILVLVFLGIVTLRMVTTDFVLLS